MFRTRFPTAHHFTASLFGCQYHRPSPDESRLALIEAFDRLVKDGAVYVEELEQTDLPSKVWVGHWKSPQDFKAWAMYESNGKSPHGFGHCGELTTLTEKTGYWGAYRSRMTQDSPDDNFSSPLSAVPEPKPLSNEIRTGRTRITKFPDNICFVVEGQDYGAMPTPERAYWDENFDGLTKQWVTNVMTAGAAKGLASGRACHAFAGGKRLGASSNGDAGITTALIPETTNGNTGTPTTNNGHGDSEGTVTANGGFDVSSWSSSLFPGLDYIRQAQLLFWLDLSYMEHIGRYGKVHIQLRRDFLAAYGPGGAMHGGELLLWVDLGVLKSDEMDAEYVGCYEGTGFLAYDHNAAFESRRDAESAALPAFFDQPRESKPMEC
ncbi:hypothetical protein PG994_005880 [Apiospora phragmitis]|uniref:Phenylacetaldoxime dehydratase n=1 Tax=Apiospora phragmitis TaxID=2905665 RepID=A0ABR1VDG5_9PEZI